MLQASFLTDQLPVLGAWGFRPAPNPNPYLLPTPARWPLVRATSRRVVVRVGARATAYDPALLTAIPDDAAWARLLAAHGAYQATLDALAAALREIGTYRARL